MAFETLADLAADLPRLIVGMAVPLQDQPSWKVEALTLVPPTSEMVLVRACSLVILIMTMAWRAGGGNSMRGPWRSTYAAGIFLACSFGTNAASVAIPPLDPIVATGLVEETGGRELLEAAAKTANAILGDGSARHLIGSWNDSAAVGSGKSPVKVFLVKPTEKDFMIEIPYKSCNCIFLQPAVYHNWLRRYSTKLKQMMDVDERHMLAFMLLHEIGHLVQGDRGEYDVAGPDYNLTDTEQKQRENGADEFAARALIAASESRGDVDASLGSMRVQMALTNVSWNLTALRLLDGFGGSALCSKVLFADKGLSHPNFELRVLAVKNIISRTTVSGELLAAFEACRKPKGTHSP